MNRYYQDPISRTKESKTYSSIPVFYPTRSRSSRKRSRSSVCILLTGIGQLFASLFAWLSEASGRRIIRCLTIAACIFAFIGVIGGVDTGVLSIGVGAMISAFLLFLEVLCLRSN